MSYLLASGDSFTDFNFQSDIVPEYDCSFPKWPELLGNRLGISEVVNVGFSGSSNTSIFNKCYDEISKRKPKLVFLLLTDISRESIFHFTLNTLDLLALENKILMTRQWAVAELNNLNWKRIPLEMAKWMWTNELFVKDIVNNTLRKIWLFQNFCKNNNIDYIIMSAMETSTNDHFIGVIKNSAKDKGVTSLSNYIKETLNSPYVDTLNENTLLGWPFFEEVGGYNVSSKLWRLASEKNQKVHIHEERDNHPNGLGHQIIADMFYKGYQDIYGKGF